MILITGFEQCLYYYQRKYKCQPDEHPSFPLQAFRSTTLAQRRLPKAPQVAYVTSFLDKLVQRLPILQVSGVSTTKLAHNIWLSVNIRQLYTTTYHKDRNDRAIF